jgi:hypothetical protein
VPIDEKFSPFFKPGKELRDRLNGTAKPPAAKAKLKQ